MKILPRFLPMVAALALAGLCTPAAAADVVPLTELARSHEQVFKGLAGEHVAVVLQKGDKQFTVYGVINVRAVGAVLEITVKNGEKYSVSPADVFFISNNGFKI